MTLRVLHVIPSLSPLRGGPSQVIRTMTRALVAAGLDVHIATTDDDGPGRLRGVRHGQPVVEEGVTVWYFPRQSTFYSISWPLAWWLVRRLRDYRIVHVHGLFCFPSTIAGVCAVRQQVPFLVRPYGTVNRYGMEQRRPVVKKLSFRCIESRLLALAHAVHYTSEMERAEAEHLGVCTSALIIPPAVEAAITADGLEALHVRYPQLQGRLVVLFMSRLDAKKGLDLLLEAFAQARREVPELALVIAGDGPRALRDDLMRQVRHLRLEDDVLWTGFVRGDQKQQLLRDSAMYVLPSHSENFGVAVAEAMGAGLPVIVSDQTALCQEVLEVGAGLVTRCDSTALARCLVEMASSAPCRRAMGEAGRRLVAQRFSTNAVTRRLLEAYQRLSQPGPPAGTKHPLPEPHDP
ncbi:MAG: glycosyltransferase [Candidatus Xenobia bacterium]